MGYSFLNLFPIITADVNLNNQILFQCVIINVSFDSVTVNFIIN